MKNCDSTRESLGAWLDGELDRAESEAVRAHLEGCVACKEEQRQLEKLQVALKSVLDSEASRIALIGSVRFLADPESRGLFPR